MGGPAKLGMRMDHRVAMLRNMVTSLIYHERIMTTTPKAKSLKRFADRMITYAKVGDLHNRRLAERYVRERPAVIKLFEILGPRYKYVFIYIYLYFNISIYVYNMI